MWGLWCFCCGHGGVQSDSFFVGTASFSILPGGTLLFISDTAE